MIYRFGPCELDTERLELRRDGEPQAVEPLVFRLLVHLIENRDRVVSKDDLFTVVWGGRIVSDASLSSRISAARTAVGDTGRAQAIIRTMPKRGFRFVAEIQDGGTAQSPLPSAARDDDKTGKPTSEASGGGRERPAIAVLPFDNLSDDLEQEYFSDGMAEDLITDISKLSGLFVAARNSSFSFKGQAVDVKTIAQQLGVKHILEGSVRKMGPKLRVNVQLIDATSGGHIWAERYDGEIEDIFQFQDDIREQIVSALQVSLSLTDRRLTERKPTDSVQAYDLFLRGRAAYHRFTPEHFHEAIKCFEEAIEIDPNFSDAHGYLAYCYFQTWFQSGAEFDDNFERANELAEKGVALDGTSAIAHTSLGWIQTFSHRHEEAIANMEKAIALAPNDAEAYATFGQVLNYWGDPERALEMIEKAFSMDTIAPPAWEFYAGHSRLLLRQYDEALRKLLDAIEQLPKFTGAYLRLAFAYIEMDRIGDANDVIKTVLEFSTRCTIKEIGRLYPYRIDEVRSRFLDSLRKAGLPEG